MMYARNDSFEGSSQGSLLDLSLNLLGLKRKLESGFTSELEIGKRIPIRVKITVQGDEMTVDLSDGSKQVRGFYNSGFTTGIACAQVAYKCLTTPTDYPVNDGSFRPLKVASTFTSSECSIDDDSKRLRK